jgi:hypothetical protein
MDLESLFVLRRCCISAAPGDAIMPSVSHPASVLRPLQEQERSNSANVGFKITLGSPDALEAWSLGPGGRITIAWPFPSVPRVKINRIE